MEKISLIEYESPDGKCPFKRWTDSIRNIQTQARIFRYVRSLSPGNFNNCKPVGEDLHELKSISDPVTGYILAMKARQLSFFFVVAVKRVRTKTLL